MYFFPSPPFFIVWATNDCRDFTVAALAYAFNRFNQAAYWVSANRPGCKVSEEPWPLELMPTELRTWAARVHSHYVYPITNSDGDLVGAIFCEMRGHC